MIRCQFYPTEALLEKINEDARRKGISQSAAVIEKLEEAYGIIGKESTNNAIPFSELMVTIQNECREYVDGLMKNNVFDAEFTLYNASQTFRGLEMADDNGRLLSMKPRIGKAFRALVDSGTVKNIAPAKTKTGKQKREHNAAVYKIVLGEDE